MRVREETEFRVELLIVKNCRKSQEIWQKVELFLLFFEDYRVLPDDYPGINRLPEPFFRLTKLPGAIGAPLVFPAIMAVFQINV